MNSSASNQQILDHIREALADAENGYIYGPNRHTMTPRYEKAKAAIQRGQDIVSIRHKKEHPEWLVEKGLAPPDLRLLDDYLFVTAFITALFTTKDCRSHEQAQSASLLVSGLGFSPEDVTRRLIEYEKSIWRWLGSGQLESDGEKGRDSNPRASQPSPMDRAAAIAGIAGTIVIWSLYVIFAALVALPFATIGYLFGSAINDTVGTIAALVLGVAQFYFLLRALSR